MTNGLGEIRNGCAFRGCVISRVLRERDGYFQEVKLGIRYYTCLILLAGCPSFCVATDTVAATALTDRGFKHVADAHLGGRDIHLCPGEVYSRTLSFPVLAGDSGTWAAWLFLEDIRTDGTNAQPGVASVQVIFDGAHTNTVFFSNCGGWAGPYFSFLPWADPSVTHTVTILNNHTNCIWIGDLFARWAVNANTNSANMHVADALIATNIQIPAGGHFEGALAFPIQTGDLDTWACWLMCEGVKTGTVSLSPGQARIKLWLDGCDYTTPVLNNQGVRQTLQEAITWEKFIGNSVTIDPRTTHTFVLQNLDVAPLTMDSLWVRCFVNREVKVRRMGISDARENRIN
jgi:hypothetical protein